MAVVGSLPVASWTQALLTLANGGVAQSGSLTATVHVTQGWEIQIPILFSHVGSISADPFVQIYASSDGGATFDTPANPFRAFAVARTGGSTSGGVQKSIRLSQGQYAIQLVNSGPNSANFGVGTQMIIGTVINS